MLWVYKVQNWVRIGLVRSRENYHLEMLVGFFKTLIYVRTHIYTRLEI